MLLPLIPSQLGIGRDPSAKPAASETPSAPCSHGQPPTWATRAGRHGGATEGYQFGDLTRATFKAPSNYTSDIYMHMHMHIHIRIHKKYTHAHTHAYARACTRVYGIQGSLAFSLAGRSSILTIHVSFPHVPVPPPLSQRKNRCVFLLKRARVPSTFPLQALSGIARSVANRPTLLESLSGEAPVPDWDDGGADKEGYLGKCSEHVKQAAQPRAGHRPEPDPRIMDPHAVL